MTDLTAIDVLINPDDAMIARAKSLNARLLTSIPPPAGFALDEHHQPHVTTLQRYVRTNDLDRVFDAVEEAVASVDMSTLSLTAQGTAHLEDPAQPGIGLLVVGATPSREVFEFQAALIQAIKPFTEDGGTADAYVRTDAEPDINAATIDYVEHYVPAHSGTNYQAHVSAGIAKLDFIANIEAEPFESLCFSAAGVGVYQLGNNGTAAKHLKSWTA